MLKHDPVVKEKNFPTIFPVIQNGIFPRGSLRSTWFIARSTRLGVYYVGKIASALLRQGACFEKFSYAKKPVKIGFFPVRG